MSSIPSSISEVVSAPRTAERRGIIGMYLVLTKARLSLLVLMTTAVGFILASLESIDWMRMLWTILGTALAAGCANTLNQVREVKRDRLMQRTHTRPLPSGAMSLTHACVAALIMGIAGVALLAALVNAGAAGLALLTILIYVFLYTPLKVRSTLNTLVGAVCGAIPPMIGWVAATGTLEPGAWALGAILFIWQIPHFLALAWLYREDYARGGFAMLPVIDRDGRITCQVIVLTTLMLLATALLATQTSVAGVTYAIGSLALGLWMLMLSVRLYKHRSDNNARRVFLASITYLPLLLCLMVIDRGPASGSAGTILTTSAVAAVPPDPHE